MLIDSELRALSTLFFVIIISISSCTDKQKDIDDDTPEYIDTTTLISSYGGKLSHNTGTDCQTCHQKGGNGRAWFTVSGTVYDSTMKQVSPNSTARIYDGLDSSGLLIATIEVDSFGNFYSTQKIDYENGLHVEVEGKTITAKMGSLIHSGSCNKCHGVTTNRIWVK